MRYSELYCDFLAGKREIRSLFASESLEEAAKGLETRPYDRQRLVALLERQNRVFGASVRTIANIRKLGEKDSLCVFAGQQAVLFGGPLLVLYKALSVVKRAESYSRLLRRPVVPIFWIAGDDHDFEEVNHTWVYDRSYEAVKIAYSASPDHALPTGYLKFSDEEKLSEAFSVLTSTLGETDFTPSLYVLLNEYYTLGDTFVTAFGKWLAHLTADYGLVLFSPADEEAKRLAEPFFLRILDEQEEIRHHLSSRNRLLSERGYHLQVHKKENATHLFYVLNDRRPILREGDSFLVGQKRYSKDELKKLVASDTEKFSPDVLLRPVFQSFLFPVLAQVGGPAEIAYYAQMNPLFEVFDLVTPYCLPRPSLTLLEKHFERIVDEHDLSLADVMCDVEGVINRVLAATFPGHLEKDFEALRRDVEKRFKEFVRESLEFDSSLEQFAHQLYAKIDFTLKQFERKIFAAHKKKSRATREKIYRLWRYVFPLRALQERSINSIYFLAKYGENIVSYIYDSMDTEQAAHQVISFSEYRT